MKTINNINSFLFAKLNLCATDAHTVGELYEEIQKTLSYIIEIPELFLVRLELLKLISINYIKFKNINNETYRLKVVQAMAYGLEVMESSPN